MFLSREAELQYLAFLEEMHPVSLILGQVVTEIPYLSHSFLFSLLAQNIEKTPWLQFWGFLLDIKYT